MRYTVRHRGGVETGIEAPTALDAVRKARVSAAAVIRVEIELIEPRCRCGVLLVGRGLVQGREGTEAMECPTCHRAYQREGNSLAEATKDLPVAVKVARGGRPAGLVRRGRRWKDQT